MPVAYLPLLFLAFLVLSLPGITLIAFKIFRPASHGIPADSRPDDSALLAEGATREGDFARFYVIAMLFVILEVGVIFLYPWAVMFRTWLAAHLAAPALLSMSFFLGVLLVGYVWIYKKGALDLA